MKVSAEPSRLDYEKMCEDLRKLYLDLLTRTRSTLEPDLLPRMGAPYFVLPSLDWCSALRRVLIVGQAPHDWSSKHIHQEPEIWFLSQALVDFDRGVRAMQESYRKSCQLPPKSAYDRACNRIKEVVSVDGVILTSNLFRCALRDERDGNMKNPWDISGDTAEEIDEWQRGVLSKEISILNPTHVLFFTGAEDDFLRNEFGPNLQFQAVADPGLGRYAFARVIWAPRQPIAARTYHPNAPQTSEMWQYIHDLTDEFLDLATQEAAAGAVPP